MLGDQRTAMFVIISDKEISETLGKETIDLYNTSDTRGQSRSYGSVSYTHLGTISSERHAD